MTPQFLRQFPTFDPATMPPIPEGWTDVSWRHEPCPNFETPTGAFVMVDFAEPADREFEELKRFMVFDGTETDATGVYGACILETDDWEQALAIVATHTKESK